MWCSSSSSSSSVFKRSLLYLALLLRGSLCPSLDFLSACLVLMFSILLIQYLHIVISASPFIVVTAATATTAAGASASKSLEFCDSSRNGTCAKAKISTSSTGNNTQNIIPSIWHSSYSRVKRERESELKRWRTVNATHYNITSTHS